MAEHIGFLVHRKQHRIGRQGRIPRPHPDPARRAVVASGQSDHQFEQGGHDVERNARGDGRRHCQSRPVVGTGSDRPQYQQNGKQLAPAEEYRGVWSHPALMARPRMALKRW